MCLLLKNIVSRIKKGTNSRISLDSYSRKKGKKAQLTLAQSQSPHPAAKQCQQGGKKR